MRPLFSFFSKLSFRFLKDFSYPLLSRNWSDWSLETLRLRRKGAALGGSNSCGLCSILVNLLVWVAYWPCDRCSCLTYLQGLMQTSRILWPLAVPRKPSLAEGARWWWEQRLVMFELDLSIYCNIFDEVSIDQEAGRFRAEREDMGDRGVVYCLIYDQYTRKSVIFGVCHQAMHPLNCLHFPAYPQFPLHNPHRNLLKPTLLNFARYSVSHFRLQFHRVASMQTASYNPKNYIKNRHSFQDLECGICFELSTELVRCRGQCKKVFCIECVSKTKNVSDRCPNRCSKPFFAVKLPTLHFEFTCPFSLQCPTPITSVEAFHHHHLVCPFTPPSQRLRRRLKQDYLCPLSHNLQFFIGKYNEMVSSICAECQQQKLCRSICRKCDEKYCIDCRMPPCSRKRCPMGHEFKLFKDCNLQYICDVCGMNASIFNTGIYDDKECNFGICQNCIERLPQDRNNNHLVRLVNNQEKCECGVRLVYLGGESKPHPQMEIEKKDCSMCERGKACPKSCPKCGLSFCLKCKSISLYDDICQFQHELTAILGSQYGGGGCMRCDKPAAVYMQDPICGVTLCLDCREYFHAITSDKQRLRPVLCEDGHKLCFMRQAVRVCRSCKVTKNVELICLQCQGKDVYYCFQCKPVPLENCYFDHPLKTNWKQEPPSRVCSICSIEHGEYKSCKKCKFYACKGCHSQSMAVEGLEELGHAVSLMQMQ